MSHPPPTLGVFDRISLTLIMDTERNFLVRRCLVLSITLCCIRNLLLMTLVPITNLVDSLLLMHALTVISSTIILVVILPGSAVLVHSDDRKQNVPRRNLEERDISGRQVCWARNEEANRNPSGDISCMYVHRVSAALGANLFHVLAGTQLLKKFAK